MNEMDKFIVSQLQKALAETEDEQKKQAIQDLINSINNTGILKEDDVHLPVQIKVTINKYDGEKKEGDEPVETIIFE